MTTTLDLDELQRTVRRLADRQEIHDVLMRYCRGIDRGDVDLVKSVYHADAWDDHGWFKGSGWEFAERQIARVVERDDPAMHCVCNELVEIDGDNAHSESYFLAYRRGARDGEPRDFLFGGRYIDRFERRNGEWKIARRQVVYEFSRDDRVEGEHPTAASDFVAGMRSRDDLVYQR